MPLPEVYDAAQQLRKIYTKKYCLHPEASDAVCRGNIINAHTIQRNGGLSCIARDGHVYGFKPELIKISKSRDSHPSPELIGLSQASTFTGFCSFHDARIFEPIERKPFICSQQQCFLLAYRALCRELFTKKAQLEAAAYGKSLDTGRSQMEQMRIQEELTSFESIAESGLRDLLQYKSVFDEMLLRDVYFNTKYYAIRLKTAPDIMCSGAIYPEFGFDGSVLQDLSEFSKRLDLITFSLIATDDGGAAVFAWVDEKYGACQKFTECIDKLSSNEVPHAILRFAIEFFENVYFSPKWWDSLRTDEQNGILERKKLALKMVNRDKRCLVDDGLRVVTWEIRSKETKVR